MQGPDEKGLCDGGKKNEPAILRVHAKLRDEHETEAGNGQRLLNVFWLRENGFPYSTSPQGPHTTLAGTERAALTLRWSYLY